MDGRKFKKKKGDLKRIRLSGAAVGKQAEVVGSECGEATALLPVIIAPGWKFYMRNKRVELLDRSVVLFSLCDERLYVFTDVHLPLLRCFQGTFLAFHRCSISLSAL